MRHPDRPKLIRFVIAAPSYAGKTTAHREGLVLDPEELQVYRAWKEGWADPTKVADPAWREAQQRAYTEVVERTLELDVPIVAVHPGYLKWALETARSLRGRHAVVVIPTPTQVARAERLAAEEEAAGKPWAASRLKAFRDGLESARALATRPDVRAFRSGYVNDAARVLLFSNSSAQGGSDD